MKWWRKTHNFLAVVFTLWSPTIRAESFESAVLYDWRVDRCSQDDISDAPPRQFRDATGRINLVASHDITRYASGRSYLDLKHECRVVFKGSNSAVPGEYDDRQWLASFLSEDGEHILALIHNEFQGNLHSNRCKSTSYLQCWENSIVGTISVDGGHSFSKSTKHVVAASPFSYSGDAGKPIGYFQPSNIVTDNSFYYFMFLAENYLSQHRGYCLARSDRPFELDSWKLWDGSGFTIKAHGPLPQSSADDRSCSTVGNGQLFEMGSLSYIPTKKLFVFLTSVSTKMADADHPAGAYFSVSRDLLQWGKPRPLMLHKDMPRHFAQDSSFGFFSLVDQNSPRFDYSTITDTPDLTLYYVELFVEGAPYSRALERMTIPARLIRFEY